MKSENINKPPRFRKQLKTITVEIPTCPCCGQDLELRHDDYGVPLYYRCNTENCGYTWRDLNHEKNSP